MSSSSSFPEPLCKPHESASQSTSDASTHLTPSDDDSEDGLPMIDESEAYELQPISPAGDVTPRGNDALQVPHPESAGLLPSPRRFSMSSVQSYELYTPDEDRAVLKKLDKRLVGFMALLYCLSFLDRSSELTFLMWFQYYSGMSILWFNNSATCIDYG